MSALNAQQDARLQLASPTAMAQALGGLRRHFATGNWIAPLSRYATDTVDRVRQDMQRSRLVNSELAEYIAASALLHCADGWSSLGRAIDCLMRGDADSARHIGYYAELRAALSILAYAGIGIFSNHHVVVTQTSSIHSGLSPSLQCIPIPSSTRQVRGRTVLYDPGTHEIAWLALDWWSRTKHAQGLLTASIAPGAVSLDSWIVALSPGFNPVHIGRSWLGTWGLDLNRLLNDRNARNQASYRPTRLFPRLHLGVDKAGPFIRDIWTLCQPSAPTTFAMLDVHLLRLVLEDVYHSTSGRPRLRGSNQIPLARIDSMLNNISPSGWSREQWRNFMARQTQANTPDMLQEALGSVPVSDPRHHIQVLARAAILLRFASGACSELIRNAGISSANLEFWWKPLGQDHGIWHPGDEPSAMADLWQDVDTAISDLEAWETSTPASDMSFATWHADPMPLLSVLGQGERIALWGLLP